MKTNTGVGLLFVSIAVVRLGRHKDFKGLRRRHVPAAPASFKGQPVVDFPSETSKKVTRHSSTTSING